VSATTAGAIKAHLERPERLVTGVPWFRDRAPKDQPLPFGVIQEGISQTRLRMGDTSDPTGDKAVVELAQATLFQAWRDADGKPAERYDLPDLVWRDLDGALLTTHPAGAVHIRVRSRVRLPRVDGPGSVGDAADGANVVQDTYTLSLHRSI
jgi:hypothetical protein